MMEKRSESGPRAVLRRGDVILVPFAFTDLSTDKMRPAVIVSADSQETDVTIAFISSRVSPGGQSKTDYVLRQHDPGFKGTGLKKASTFKMRKLLTIEQTMVIRCLGRVTPTIQNQLDARLKRAIGL